MTRIIAIAFTLAAVATSLAASAATITKGPVLQRVGTDRITVTVELDEAAALTVEYGTTASLGQKIESPGALRHEIEITGLAPATAFHYLVSGAEAKANPRAPGGVNQLGGVSVTAPEPGERFTFLIYGDSRSRPDVHHQVALAAAKEPVDFAVNTGDLVANGGDLDQWQEYFDIEHDLLRNLPLFSTGGNHEKYGATADIYEEMFTLPNPAGNEMYYSFIYGNAFFLVLDANVYATALGDFSPDQKNYLQQELARAQADTAIQHRFVLVHQGAYSSNPDRSGNMYMRSLLGLFKEYGVSLLISGHDHFYERGDTVNGMPYVVIGGGGAPLYDTVGPGEVTDERYPHMVHVAQKTDCYAVAEIEGAHFRMTAKAPDGTVLDTYEYDAAPPPAPECDSPADCAARPAPDATCTGAYECESGYCIYQCAWAECRRDRDCEKAASDICGGDGTGICALGECQFTCDPRPPECAADSDCDALTAPDTCEGTWRCDSGNCAFECGGSAESTDAGSLAPDGGTAEEPETDAGGGPGTDTPPEPLEGIEGSAPVAAPVDSTDAGAPPSQPAVPDGADGGAPGSPAEADASGGGCACAQGSAPGNPAGAFVWFAALAVLGFRRRVRH